jgi:hypothetical protein
MIEIFLSTDGKHTVHVSAETPEQLANLAPKAKELYERIVESYGNKAQMWQLAIDKKPSADVKPLSQGKAEIESYTERAPICPIHQRPMRLRQGKRGSFWSCSAKDAFGNWCTQTKNAADTAS